MVSSEKPFVIAEMSGNHNGSLERALEIVRAAADAGASAIKIQTYTADTITLPVSTGLFRVSTNHPLWGDKTLYKLYQEAHTPWNWHKPIFDLAKDLGILAFSTPFDESAVDLLEDLNVPLYKIASLEIVDIPLIQLVASTLKPLIISTGTAKLSEVAEAVEAARAAGCEDLTLLACTSSYPAEPKDSNLRRMESMRKLFGVKVGFSDHTPGIAVAIAASALGATVIEKHLTLKRSDGGVDAAFSVEPEELRLLIEGANQARDALGGADVWSTPSEAESLRHRPSLYLTKDVQAGELLTPENVRSVRPSGGLAPKELYKVLGGKVRIDAPMGTPLSWDIIDINSALKIAD